MWIYELPLNVRRPGTEAAPARLAVERHLPVPVRPADHHPVGSRFQRQLRHRRRPGHPESERDRPDRYGGAISSAAMPAAPPASPPRRAAAAAPPMSSAMWRRIRMRVTCRPGRARSPMSAATRSIRSTSISGTCRCSRTIDIREGKRLQFRFEMFNVFNVGQYALGNADVAPVQVSTNAHSPSYANVTAANFLNARQFDRQGRSFQLGLKFSF